MSTTTSTAEIANLANPRAARLLNGPVLATLLGLAVPNIIVVLAQAGANFLESYYVGLLGTDALAGAALVFPLVMLMQTMSAGGIGGGISSAIARAIGAGKHEEAEAIALHALILAIVLGLVFGAAAILGGRVLYATMGGTWRALDAALGYSNAIFAGAVFLWLLKRPGQHPAWHRQHDAARRRAHRWSARATGGVTLAHLRIRTCAALGCAGGRLVAGRLLRPRQHRPRDPAHRQRQRISDRLPSSHPGKALS
jgi:hypothetical protein